MVGHEMGSGEDVAAELVRVLRLDAERGTTDAELAVWPRSDVVKWSESHEEAVLAALRSSLDQGDPLKSPFSAPLLALGDIVAAYTSADPEALIRPWPPRVSGVEGGPTMGVLTPLTDVDELLHALLRHVPRRPRYRTEAPRVSASLGEQIDPVELGEYLGLRPIDLAELWSTRPTAAQERRILDALVSRLLRDAPHLGAVMAAAHRTDSSALASVPFVRVFSSVLRGVRGPGAIQLVHIVDLNGSGELAMVIVPSTLATDARGRAELSAYLRHLADHRVAPWQRWSDPRARREALTLYARRVSGLRPAMQEVATLLRQRHAQDYAGETREVTARRIKRISAEIKRVEIPRSMRLRMRTVARQETPVRSQS